MNLDDSTIIDVIDDTNPTSWRIAGLTRVPRVTSDDTARLTEQSCRSHLIDDVVRMAHKQRVGKHSQRVCGWWSSLGHP